MRTIIKVDIRTYQILYKVRVYIYKSENIAIRNKNISEYGSEHRKVMCTGRETQECYVGTRNRNRNKIRTGTGTGTKLEMVILRMVLVIPEFECGTEFWESRELVRSCDSSASRADEFRGGTSARGVTGDVTGSGLAEIVSKSHECYGT